MLNRWPQFFTRAEMLESAKKKHGNIFPPKTKKNIVDCFERYNINDTKIITLWVNNESGSTDVIIREVYN